MSDFFDAIRRFLLDYLPKQRCLSKNTILSYRQTLNIFVAYMKDEITSGCSLQRLVSWWPLSADWHCWVTTIR